MARFFRHMEVLRKIGRRGDFSKFPSLDKEYKYHRHGGSSTVGAAFDAMLENCKRSSHDVARACVKEVTSARVCVRVCARVCVCVCVW